ncbi:putative 5-dehydro-4-deoxyglucarate dehydratase [Streptomyces spiroverticillatus]|uniref:Probable 5-dehydro-4-deoxyglucarate dehydratase n=1 Tax=Streptomyces finlayi TaxID=67296 RepID=A0A919CGG9_9ACTN|nr:5-dehydro-4-deoxyglucarate dehydratase [Streptomyces finlayi]GHA47423.1 putative 5-dehydro-4-deoxyglucarate dehydratase [Streptomyces spiroverticillatus]GHD18507.1 putative 5-dehydro-4-deoxyglucarate dehydratase [Streptomyces finlayi]
MAQPPIELDGLLAFPLTPFTADFGLDLDAFAETVEGHVAAGAGALFIACGTGEFSALAPDEHTALLRRAREVVAGRVPVWVGAGGGAATARAGVAAAQEGGADGVLLLPPYLVSGPPSGLVDHVRHAVHDTTVPVVVYHRSNGAFTPGSALELLDIPSVAGLKDGVGDVELMTRIVTTIRSADSPRADGFLFFNGLPTAEVSARAYKAIGVARYSSAVHCFAPEIAIRFHGALAAGDDRVVEALLAGFYLPLVALRDETPGFAVSLVKSAARLRGDRVGPVRPPLVEPSAEQIDRLQKIVKNGYALLAALDGDHR